MGRLFFKTCYTFALWVLLLINLFFAFDLTYIVGAITSVNADVDYTEVYFGISTLINALKGIGEMPIGQFTNNIGTFYRSIFEYANDLLQDGIVSVSDTWSDVNNFWDVITSVGETLFQIGKMIYTFLVYMFGFSFMLVYIIMLILSFVFTLFQLLNGYYYTPMPNSVLLNSFICC